MDREIGRVLVSCDVGPTQGVGHVMRCLALSEELLSRGVEVVFSCDAQSVPWAYRQITERGISVTRPSSTSEQHIELLRDLRADAVIFDSYELPSETYRDVRAHGLPTMALVDGDLRGAEADVLVDQTIGAENDAPSHPLDSVRLAGLDYALMRDDVLARRPTTAPVARQTSAPSVFGFFGGTDPLGVGPMVLSALARTSRPFCATLVAPREELRDEIARVRLSSGQVVKAIGPTRDVAQQATAADLVISAAGSSVWELMCLGAPTAVVCVADNQRVGYARAVASGAVAGAGRVAQPGALTDKCVRVFTEMLSNPEYRSSLSAAAWRLVDGHGRTRVVDMMIV